jgi:3-dehydroquinate synthase
VKRRVVITGAQGFLGRYLVAHWLRSDPEVEIVGLGRSKRREDAFTHVVHWGDKRVPAPLPPEVLVDERSVRYRYVALDLRGGSALTGLLQEVRPHVVVHLAGELRDAAPDLLFSTNVGATIALLEAIAGAGIAPPRVVLGSSGAVYGHPADGALPLRETEPCVPRDLYATSKRAAEDAARILADRYGIPLLSARIFNAVGPGQDERHVCGWLAGQAAAIAAGVIPPRIELGSRAPTRDFIDALDVARALVLLADRGDAGEVYNVGSGVETSVGAVLLETLRLSGLDESVCVERPGRDASVPRHVADPSRLRALGFTPKCSLRDSLADLLAYYRGPVARAAASLRSAEGDERKGPLSVTVSRAHEYPVVVEPGLLRSLPARLRALFPAARMMVLDDVKVHGLYGAAFCAALREAGIDVHSIAVPDQEGSKSPECARRVIERLHAHRFDRRGVLVNLGGGLVSDLGGYVAATYLRGVAYVNVPTTLLAQHDSSIGGKVAVNMPWAKNFVGAFHHPRAVFCDPEVLATLSHRNLGAGVAEAVKVAVIAEPGLFELLEDQVERVRRRDVGVLGEIVRRAAATKIAILGDDPHEVDLRRSLNLGHTFGHPLEVELGYAGLLHGEAVAVGIAVATEIARARGVCAHRDADRIDALLRAYDLPPAIRRDRLHAARRRLDEVRLVRGGRLNFVLPERIGAVQIVAEVADEEIARAVEAVAMREASGVPVPA